VKSDERKPLRYVGILAVLLAWRIGVWFYGYTRKPAARSPARTEATTAESA
jgi:hypothetical protein